MACDGSSQGTGARWFEDLRAKWREKGKRPRF